MLYGKPNATGRSSGRRKGGKPPKGEPWVWLTREVLSSPSWMAMSANARRLVDFLLLEHLSHAGTENGNLAATHKQLEIYGLTRNCIAGAVEECVFLGLVRFERGGRWGFTNKPSRFRLTFYPDKNENPATNEWKGKTSEAIAEWKSDIRLSKKRKATRKSAGTALAKLRVVTAESTAAT